MGSQWSLSFQNQQWEGQLPFQEVEVVVDLLCYVIGEVEVEATDLFASLLHDVYDLMVAVVEVHPLKSAY